MLKHLINKSLLSPRLVRTYTSTPITLPKTIRFQLSINEVNKDITVKGWVKSVRKQKNLIFIELNDGSQFDNLQLILESDKLENVNTGTCLEVSGKLSESPGKNQSKEVLINSLKVLGNCPTEDYPLQKKRHTLEFVRANAHLRARTNTNSSVLRVRNAVLRGLDNYFQGEEFIQVHTPIITSNDCEGGGEVFRVESNEFLQAKPDPKKPQFQDYFDSPAYLSVSGQLHLEAVTSGMSRVYCINPAFRAEKSMTSRHLSEFWMCEAEVAFIDNLDQLTEICEESVKGSIRNCLNLNHKDLQFFTKFYDNTLIERLEEYNSIEFPRITYTKAIEILQASGVKFEHPVEWGLSLQSEHEKYLAQEYCKSPVFVTDYPKELKPFYMKLNRDGKTVACFDLLVPHIGELAGGSMREDNYDILLENIKHHNMDLDSLKWYLDLRKFGSFPHGGYGIGLDRLVQFVTAMQSIRDVIPFPRYFNNCNY